ncbi:hypothetical protein [Thalassorhabdus alkalitolerans]
MELWKAALILFFLYGLWKGIFYFSFYKGWTVSNFKGKQTPYTAGMWLVLSFLVFIWVPGEVTLPFISGMIYLVAVWIAGWLDDRYGKPFPKGIKGHINHFFKSGEMTTGLLKLTVTVVAAFFAAMAYPFEHPLALFFTFSLLVLGPHMFNLLDTRPLRVWKVFFVYGILLLYVIREEVTVTTSLLLIMVVWFYIEAAEEGMLGDNGAAASGGLLFYLTAVYAPLALQAVVSGLLLFFTIYAERHSLTSAIAASPFLSRIDSWGIAKK